MGAISGHYSTNISPRPPLTTRPNLISCVESLAFDIEVMITYRSKEATAQLVLLAVLAIIGICVNPTAEYCVVWRSKDQVSPNRRTCAKEPLCLL